MTKQRTIGILTLLSLLIGAALTALKGGTIDFTAVLPGVLAGLGLVLHPPTDAAAPAAK